MSKSGKPAGPAGQPTPDEIAAILEADRAADLAALARLSTPAEDLAALARLVAAADAEPAAAEESGSLSACRCDSI